MLNTMIATANSAGPRWAAWIVGASLDAAVLLAFIGLAWLVVRDRVAPQVGYRLFLLVPLKLLAPVVLTVPAAAAGWTPSAVVASWLASDQEVKAVEAPRSVDLATAPPPIVEPAEPTFPPVPQGERPTAAAARPAFQPVAAGPRPSASATLMVAWLVGVLALSARFAAAQLRLRRRVRGLDPLDAAELPVDFRDLCARAGVRRTVRIAESDVVAAPSVCGIVRPTLIVPRGIAGALNARQLRWTLLHELAHIRRHDLAVVALQRCAAILHFFNPAVWIANRMIHQLREYRCDDFALERAETSAVESGEAFVRILQSADRRPRGLEGALGVFGLNSRACCLRRVHRLLDADRPIRSTAGAPSIAALVVVAAVAVPHLRASHDAPPDDPQEPAREAAVNEANLFELRVVGPDGRPVPEALVQIRTSPGVSARDVRRGAFDRAAPYGAFIKADAEGRLAVARPPAPATFDVLIEIPGYGPYWGGWGSRNHVVSIPPSLTAELEAAWSVGGVVVDDAGKAVEGAKIGPSIEFKKRPGETRQLGSGAQVETDAAGRWRFDSVPASMSEVHVEISRPDFKPNRRPLPRSGFGVEPGRAPTAKIILERGLTVVGKVVDEAGAPIAGALVRTKFLNDVREATTGADGSYKLVGCEPRSTRIVVSAKGKATDMKELDVEPGMAPVDFRMKPGGTVRVRVLDARGEPIPKARIFFQRWRGPFKYFEFDQVGQYADEDGVWVWHEAPLDEFKADVCPPNGMQRLLQPLIARDEEYVIRLPDPLVVTGKVVDAATGGPVKAFEVVPGIRSTPDRMNWARGEGFAGGDGRFEFRPRRGYLAHLIRIEAAGYQPAVSREIASTEGDVSIDFELKRGTGVAAKVTTPDGLPAAGARLALGIAGSQINIKNGDVDDGSTYSARATADDAGRFGFPAQVADFQLVITHPSGFAHIKSTPEWDPSKAIKLEPWSRVEGVFRVGPNPVPNAPLTINVARPRSYGPDVPSIFTTYDTTTGTDGRYAFERVFPGRASIGRRIMLTVDDGAAEATSSCMVPVELPAGKTLHLDLGGTGRAVVGALRPAEGFSGKVRWNFGLVHAQLRKQDPRGPYLTASIDRDGTFRIDDAPPGEYQLHVRFDRDRDGPGQLFNHPFKVPPQDAPDAPPIDLGTLELKND